MILFSILTPLERRPPQHPRVAARDDRAPVGLGDRRADRDGAAADGPARGQADPLDAGDAGAHAGDEGDPAALQARQGEAEPGADEVLPGQPGQPGRSVPAAPRPVPRLHRALPRAAAVLEAPAGRKPVVVRRPRPGHHGPRERALVGLPPARDLRRQPARLDVLHVHDDGQDAADDDDDPPGRVRPGDRQLPGRARHLLGDDEPVDGRPGGRHAPVDAEGDASAETVLADSAEVRAAESKDGAAEPEDKPAAPPAQPRRVRRKKKKARR